MDIYSLEEFIRMQKESLAREKHEFGLELEQTRNPNKHPTEFPDDHLVPSLTETACTIPDNDSSTEQQQMPSKDGEMIRNQPVHLQAHRRHQLVEQRRAVTAEKPQPVSESFYNYFPSLNTKKQQILEERRQEYFEYLKRHSPRPTHEEVRPQNAVTDDHDEQRKMEKDRLAAQFQKSKQKSILNYQIVEARNRRAEEEEQRKKQEYYNELRKQIEDQKRRQQEQKQMEKFEEDIANRKLELDELEGIAEVAPPRLPPRVPLQQPNPHRKTTHDNQVERETHRISLEEQESHMSYNYFSNSAKDRQQLVQHIQKKSTSKQGPEHNPCCDNYKQILEKLELLCRWRDDFVAKKMPTERRSGCLLCDSGNLRNCNFCDYHDSVLKGRADRSEEFFTEESDQESLLQYNITEKRELTTSNRPLKMIAHPLSEMPTPQGVVVQRQRHEPIKEMPMTDPRNSSFINFDDIPLPTQRSSLEARQDVERIPDCRRRLNEMKKVEWKWDIPAVQKNSITKDKPEKVLTQLGAIRKQLQMEQLKQLNID